MLEIVILCVGTLAISASIIIDFILQERPRR